MPSKAIEKTKSLMAALGRMPPKPHDQMKLGKKRSPTKKSRRVASAKPKSA